MFDRLKELVSSALENANTPIILAGLAGVGLVSTVILAAKASPKAKEIIEDEDYFEEEEAELNTEEGVEPEEEGKVRHFFKRSWRNIRLTWKVWLPTLIAGLATGFCIYASTAVSVRQVTAWSAAYALSESNRLAYKESTKEVVGNRTEQQIRQKVIEKQMERNPEELDKEPVYYTGKGSTLMWDYYTERLFLGDIQELYSALLRCNNRLNGGIEPYLSLNDIYEEIGLRPTPLGSLVGWRSGDEIKLDEVTLQFPTLSGPQYFAVQFETDPYPGFRDGLHG